MRALSVIALLALLFLPTGASAEVQTFTATHTYVLGDHDSKDDARQRCLLEAKRKVLEQAGAYIENSSEIKDFQLTKDKITSFAAAVMQVKDTKEKLGFESGHITLTLTLKADVDLAEVHKQLLARQVDIGVRDTVKAQQERLNRLEAQFEAMQQQQQGGQTPGQAPRPTVNDLSTADLQKLKTQATQGTAWAQVELGLRYGLGYGVPQDYAQAQVWYEKAAVQGNAMAQLHLGWLYSMGYGVPQDYFQARQWYEKAAAQGNAMAQVKLGVSYYLGLGAAQDYVQARQWYEKAAAQGNADAQLSLGLMYENGRGVPQDYAIARQWWEKAAAQGSAAAQLKLGLLYSLGWGVEKDYVLSAQWYEKAAAQGDAYAQFNLGVLYDDGHGVPQDYVRAYMWFNLAAAGSDGEVRESAAKDRESVARRMTPAQLAEAQQRARQCLAQQFKGC